MLKYVGHRNQNH